MSPNELLLNAMTNLIAAVSLMALLWLLSLRLKDASIVDRFWGLGFVMVAWLSWALHASGTWREVLMLVLVSAWGLRLSAYITWRNWGHGEDRRYAAMRALDPGSFPRRSLWTVFLLQGVLLWAISLPLQAVFLAPGPSPLVWTDALGVLLACTGIALETTADFQMARFRRRAGTGQEVMDQGLWRYSRHPNYFGDAVTWWGFYLLSCASPWGVWTLPAPVIMTWLLRRVSGVPLLEQDLRLRRPAYAAYVRSTPPFVPWFPRKDQDSGTAP